jgi:mannose-6-phosphate isomerase-like protein (cupin superfamily)
MMKTKKKAKSRKAPSRPRTKAAKRMRKTGAPQRFTYSYYDEKEFKTGLRSYAQYRDLGVADATKGFVRAHVIRMVPPCIPDVVSKPHYHEVQFQMIYVLKGWMKGEYDGEVVTFKQGSCWLQPPKIKHTVLGYSDDCELLEIIVPADFDTVEL